MEEQTIEYLTLFIGFLYLFGYYKLYHLFVD